ncbi:transmembrane protein [Pseudomonas sp. ATCC 13867]|uniref:cytochrome c biogenesis protein DipZ n=1 Tax=Pseudomonas sp. ATCC 13867 TaxID=1294143 RepID=UPI0002C4ECA8|nr:cytochrome c biogenesis protein DipZ [Pseudomonas sp. ATCC 13867]AGI23121.1 transmembrane protein [Pseudomonas sp. ATCC 13867]RFQ34580.1 cytochrome c biogenesis protein DipZ [Pseudomonas sp. ATCC 13867]
MLLIAFLGGALTLLSPCILPVLPLLLQRAGGPAWSPWVTLLGLASGFAVLASLATVSSNWVIAASEWGRYVALALLSVSAVALLWPRFGDTLAKPWTWIGDRLQGESRRLPPALSAWLPGFAAGLLWAPCAGPVLGLILSGAMLQGPSAQTSLLLFAYGLGSATVLGIVLFAGRRLMRHLRPRMAVIEGLRRATGVLALLAVVGIASGASAQLASGSSSTLVNSLERKVVEGVPVLLTRLMPGDTAQGAERLPDLGPAPELLGAVEWINSPELHLRDLRGKVVLIDFWTYDCINCQHSLPYVNAWAKTYADQGLVVIGVHTPEYPYERIPANVREAVKKHDIHYPVALDNQYRIWNAFGNQYWPAHYLIDAQGRIRYLAIGEGGYGEQEAVIKALLKERDGAAG